jgi:Tol biopolymer transport system component
VPRVRLALLLALAVLAALPASAGAVLGGTNGRIMFASGRDTGTSQAGLFMRTIVGSQGSGQVFPAVAPVGGEQERHPSWSPDRRRVVYARGTSGNFEIHIAELTEVADTTITDTSDNFSSDRPAWSPDGTKIAWEENAKSGNTNVDIVVYDVATGNKTDITNSPSESESKPAWSPDSKTIYYAKGNQAMGKQDIVSRPAAGGTESGPVVADSGINEWQPSISPDGTKICFTLQAAQPSSDANVLVAPLTTPPSGGLVLSSDDGTPPPHKGNYNCTWSPDGRFVAYVRGTFSNGDLVMEHADNSDLTPIILEATPSEFDGNPDWAPDGPPLCSDSKTQVIQGKTARVKLPCRDTGPQYERTNVTEAIADDSSPAHGKLGSVKQGNPSSVPYTANAKYTGPDAFEFVGLGINGGSDRGLASILVLQKGPCANMKTGNAGHNVLNGTIAGDRLLGLNGKDVLRGFAARDCLFGGAGDDTLNGGGNADRLKGEDGKDTLIGGPGGDRLNGGKGKDRFDAGKGDDKVLAADRRAETVNCGAGDDDRATIDHADTQHGCEHVKRK